MNQLNLRHIRRPTESVVCGEKVGRRKCEAKARRISHAATDDAIGRRNRRQPSVGGHLGFQRGVKRVYRPLGGSMKRSKAALAGSTLGLHRRVSWEATLMRSRLRAIMEVDVV
jgi:hypothetical protein